MINDVFLTKIGFDYPDISVIIDKKEKYGNSISALAEEYMADKGFRNNVPYTSEEYLQKRERARVFLSKAAKVMGDNEGYMSQLLFWLCCVPHAKQYYDTHGISEEVFLCSMSDLACKTEMCKRNNGKLGIYIDWFYLFFDYFLFGLGRLQFYIERFEADTYSEGVYRDCSNLKRFSGLFDILYSESSGQDFLDARNIFGVYYTGDTECLPTDTTLRRDFVKYIKHGGDFGVGYGVLLYDGEKIINTMR